MRRKNRKTVVIAGAGFGGIYTAIRVAKKGFNVILIDEKDKFTFTPLLHEVASGSLRAESVQHPIKSFLDSRVSFRKGRVTRVNLEKREMEVSEERESKTYRYDYAVIATGSRTNFYGLKAEGVEELKSIEDAERIRNKLGKIAKETEECRIAVVGGGATGVEMACEIGQIFKDSKKRGLNKKVILIHEGDVLPKADIKIREKAGKAIEELGIEKIDSKVAEVRKKEVVLKTGKIIPADMCIWTAGVTANTPQFSPEVRWNGFLRVNELLQVTTGDKTYGELFALGDCTITPDNAPMLAQTAEAEAKVCAENIDLLENMKEPERFKFAKKGFLVSLGRGNAAAEVFGIRFGGWFAWWLWRTIYLFKLPGIRNKISVAVHWTEMLFKGREV